MVELLTGSLRELAFGIIQSDLDAPGVGPEQEAQVRAAADALLSLASSLSASSASVTASQLARAGGGTLTILALGLVASAYLVLRPFSSAFRMKRMLFNLAATPDHDLTNACTTWHVSRSTGMYEAERRVIAQLRVPREKPFDLILSLIATTLIFAGIVSSWAVDEDEPLTTSDLPLFAVLVLMPVLLRLGWLARTYRDRSDGMTGRELPDYPRLPVTGLLVDRRPVSESIGWSLLLYTAPFIWFRLARLTDRLMFEHATLHYSKPRLRGPWLAVGSAFVMWLFPPVALFGRVWRTRRLPGSHKLDYALATAVLAWYVGATWVYASADPESSIETFGLFAVLAVAALAVGMGQALANRQVHSLRELHIRQSAPLDTSLRFNPPPDWPDPPDGWSPPGGWQPDATWPEAPAGWHFWVAPPT